jgi:hypothetical protein
MDSRRDETAPTGSDPAAVSQTLNALLLGRPELMIRASDELAVGVVRSGGLAQRDMHTLPATGGPHRPIIQV